MIKDKISIITYCTILHLVLFFAIVNLVMTREEMLEVMEYVLDSFEIIFSLLPLCNPNILLDAATKAVAMEVLAIFIATAIPAYVIGYPLFSLSGTRR